MRRLLYSYYVVSRRQVYADAKVNWFFLDGAFVLQSVHKRDHAQLEKGEDKSQQKALIY